MQPHGKWIQAHHHLAGTTYTRGFITLTSVHDTRRWGAPSKTELEVLFGVGHWHCIEDAEGMEGCLRRFAKKVDRKTPQF